jgi:hypothetical protein
VASSVGSSSTTRMRVIKTLKLLGEYRLAGENSLTGC